MTRPLTLCLAFLPLVSCVESRYQPCGDDISWLCPAGTVCDVVNNVCSERSEQCLNAPDGEECTVGGGAGVCTRGTCRVLPGPRCDDGKIDPGEDCEGDNLNGFTCRTVPEHFYEERGLRCNACKFDTAECTGWCGDGKKNGPELCDPTDPAIVGFCAPLGFSAGTLGCLDTCNGGTTDRCIQFGWLAIESGLLFVQDMWGAHGQLIAVDAYPRGLRWFDGEVWRNWPGGVPWSDLYPYQEPYAIWGTSLSDFWIALSDIETASNGGLAHWDGKGWSFTPHPNQIRALWGSGDDDIFGVGLDGQIHHYDGDSWSATASPAGATALYDISGSGPRDVYAVGGDMGAGVALRFDGTTWSSIDVGNVKRLTSVWASGPDDVWIMEDDPESLSMTVLHFDGAEWQRSLSVSSLGLGLGSVAGRDNEVWAAGDDALYRFDGVRWMKIRVSSRGITVSEKMWVDPTVVALANFGPVGIWAGVGQLDFDRPPTNVWWRDVWGVSSTDWVAVGNRDDGMTGIAYHEYDGRVWTFPELVRNVAGFDRDDVYATSERGSIYHFDGELWTVSRSPPGDSTSYYGNLIQTAGTRDVYVLDLFWPANAVSNGVLSRFDGSEWRFISTPEEGFNVPPQAMWIFSADDIWLFEFGRIWHFDGSTWLDTDALALSQFEDEGNFISAWGTGPDDLYAVSWPRTVWHYDGTNWTFTRVGLADSAFYQIRGLAADDVFVAGGAGNMAHFDGRVWEPMGRLDVRSGVVSMAAVPGVVLAVGPGGDGFNGIEGLLRTRLWNCRSCERDPSNRIDDDCDGQVDELDIGCQRWEP